MYHNRRISLKLKKYDLTTFNDLNMYERTVVDVQRCLGQEIVKKLMHNLFLKQTALIFHMQKSDD